MDIKAKMHSQGVYYCESVDLVAEQKQCLEVLYDFNQTRPSEGKKRQQIMKQLFAEVGKGC